MAPCAPGTRTNASMEDGANCKGTKKSNAGNIRIGSYRAQGVPRRKQNARGPPSGLTWARIPGILSKPWQVVLLVRVSGSERELPKWQRPGTLEG